MSLCHTILRYIICTRLHYTMIRFAILLCPINVFFHEHGAGIPINSKKRRVGHPHLTILYHAISYKITLYSNLFLYSTIPFAVLSLLKVELASLSLSRGQAWNPHTNMLYRITKCVTSLFDRVLCNAVLCFLLRTRR